ncbi:PKD-like domain-containing protein [Fulvivirga sp.]|uniref:PKD-like domain-containing protein n=1 Tax=Fulvivirga sp. TaxID=1931237 RepID=UPI0032EB4344
MTDVLTNTTGAAITATYSITPTVNGGLNCTTLPAVDVVITIESEPEGTDQSFFRCSDQTLAYNIQTQNINTVMAIDQLSQFTYIVTSSDPGNVPAGADRLAPSIDPITDGYINDTGVDVTITYTITPIGLLNGCVGDPFDVEFVYRSKPKGFNDTEEICSDIALNYNIQTQNIDDAINGNSLPSDFTYSVVSSSGSVPPAPNRTVKSALPITDTYTNNTGAPVDIIYTITPISQGTNCPGVPFTVTFTIDSEPLGSNATVDVCGGGTINFDLQGQITNGITSRFYYSVASSSPGDVTPDPDRPIGSASTAGITTSYTNTSGAPVLITYTVTPVANDATNCEGNPFLVRFNIIPGPRGDADTDTYCSGEAINYNIQTDNVNVLGNSIPGKYTYTVTSLNPGAISIVPGSLDRLSATAVPITDVFTNETAGNATVRYTITPISDTGGCVGTPFDVDFVIQPAPNGEDDLGNIVCSGEPVTYDFQVDNIDIFNGLASEFSYTVVSSDPVNVPADPNSPFGVATTINTSYLNTTSSPVFITYTVTPRETGSGDNCEGEPFDVRFQINPEPVLNPSLDNTVCSKENSNVTFATNGTSVNALNYIIDDLRIPAGLTPQPGNVAILPGGVSATYIRNDQYENLTNGPLTVEYDVIPVSSAGCQGDLVTILLEVLPEPVLDPALSPTPVCSGLPSGVVLSEEAGSIAAVTYNINGISVPAGLTASAGNAIIGDGQSANAIQNDTFINTTSVPLQVIYTITPVSADGCEGDDQTVTFTINPSPAIASNLDKTVCYDEASGIVFNTAATSAAAVSYDITNVVIAAGLTQTAGNTGVRNGVATTEVSLDQFENNTNNPLTVTYTVRGETAAGCTGPTTDIVLTVEPQITASPVNNNPTICSTSLTDIDLLSPTTPTSGVITFNYTAVSSIGGQLSGFQPVANNLPLGHKIEDNLVNNSDNAATVTYTITAVANGAKSGAGCSGPSVDVVVNVEPKPKLETSSIFETVCEGESLAIDLTSPTVLGSGTLEFEITSVVETGGVTGFSPLGTTFNNGDQLADLLDNPTTSDQTVTYQITPRATGTLAVNDPCEGDPVTIVVTVRPRPTVTPSINDIQICSGEIVNISLPTDVANSIAAWTVSSNANVIGQFDGLGGSLFQSLINTSSTQQVLTYTVEPFLLLDNGCTGPIETITVTIDPVPDVIINESQISICAGETVDILLNGNTPNTTYIVKASSTNPNISGYVADTLVNGESINQVIAHTGTTPGTILYTITPQIIQPSPDVDPCAGLPQVVIVTVSPPVSAEILTEDEILCIGNNKAIEFQLAGSAPFKLTLEKTDADGVVTTEILENLATRHVILANESVSYRIVEMEDFYNCVVNPSDEVNIVFEQAEADFTINGSKNPEAVTLDFNSGTVTVDIVVNNFQPANTYKLQIGDDILLDDEISASFQYTFTSPSEFGTLGYSVELQVESPNAFNCNDVENFFIEVLPAQPTVVGVADILEGCPPFTVNFESFREDLSLSKNVIVEDLTWTIDGNTLRTPNPTFTFTERGVYNVRVEGDNGHGDTATDELVITVFDKPSAIFEITQTVVYIPDDGFRPTNRSQRASEYEWDFGDFSFGPENQFRSPEHFYEEEGEYIVTLNVKNDFGCVDTAVDTVIVEEGGFTKTPNAFTPSLNGPSGGAEFDPSVPGSGDAANDIFLPITNGVTEFKMYIYDRWGNLIFFSDNKRVGWDGYNSRGQLLPPGVYVYKLDLILSSGQRTTRVGDVTLIR